jgi:hypothetical protein
LAEKPKKEKCPDCQECQMCSETRCHLCKEGGCGKGGCELGSSFTYGDYLKWKRKKSDEERADY